MHPAALITHAGELVARLLRFEHPADGVLSHYFREHRELGPRDRATLAEAGYAVLRFKPRFEHWCRERGKSTPQRLALLGLALHTDLPLDSVAAEERGWLDRCRQADIAALPAPMRHGLPTWLANALHDQYGDQFEPLAQSLLQGAPLDLRVNILKARRDEVLAALRERKIDAQPTAWSPWGIRIAGRPNLQHWPEFEQGVIEVQDEGSQLLAALLDARRGEMVADFCAGAGGKTLAIGAMMRGTGRLYAFDVSQRRLDQLKPRLAKSGLSNVQAVAIAHERDARIKRLAGKIDRVLVDAPCSGLGTLRRNPDLKWRQTPATVEEMRAKQLAILQAAASLLAPGGRLVYATCSLLRAENEAVIEDFLQATPGFVQVGVEPWAAKLGLTDMGPSLRLLPHRHGTDGFFAAVLQRGAAAPAPQSLD
jgi:16S rRNA (cytosine967-C5)-methyltransferase